MAETRHTEGVCRDRGMHTQPDAWAWSFMDSCQSSSKHLVRLKWVINAVVLPMSPLPSTYDAPSHADAGPGCWNPFQSKLGLQMGHELGRSGTAFAGKDTQSTKLCRTIWCHGSINVWANKQTAEDFGDCG